MPGIVKNRSVNLKKGYVNDNKFWDWYNKIKMNSIERQNVVIKLLDEGGNPVMT
jgi:phage tail-like protein